MLCTLFPLTMVLSHWVFSSKVFNEADYHTQKGYCTLFPSLEFFPIRFFSSKILMRLILDGHPRASVMNIINGCPYNKLVNGLYY